MQERLILVAHLAACLPGSVSPTPLLAGRLIAVSLLILFSRTVLDLVDARPRAHVSLRFSLIQAEAHE